MLSLYLASLQLYGVKGPSWLSTVPNFDLVQGVAVDYMHCVLLGVTRLLLRLWFTSSHHKEPWYIGRHVVEVDKRLCAIRPPDEILRTPRSVEKTVKYWKGQCVCMYMYVLLIALFVTFSQLTNFKLGFSIIALLFYITFYQKNTISIICCWLKVCIYC